MLPLKMIVFACIRITLCVFMCIHIVCTLYVVAKHLLQVTTRVKNNQTDAFAFANLVVSSVYLPIIYCVCVFTGYNIYTVRIILCSPLYYRRGVFLSVSIHITYLYMYMYSINLSGFPFETHPSTSVRPNITVYNRCLRRFKNDISVLCALFAVYILLYTRVYT